MTEGGTHPGTKLVNYSDIQYQLLHDLHWLPDGSGFLFSTSDLMRSSSNIFHYDFKTKQTKQLTRFENDFAKKFSVSPDGKWIVYERTKEYDENSPADLWIQAMDGSESRLLTKNAHSPSWSR